MFQKKPIYIVGVILFTLILVADLLLFFLVPTGMNAGGMRENFDSTAFTRPSGGDFAGQLPDGSSFDGSGMDAGGFTGQRPGDSSTDFTVPAGVDRPQMPSGSQTGGVLTAIRSAAIPIAIVCVLADALCIFMLIRISRKNREETEEIYEDTSAGRDRTNIVLAVIAVVLVAAVIVSGLPSGSNGAQRQVETELLQAEAALEDLVSYFSGSGTLESDAAQSITIPVAVSVTAYTVQNGDRVTEGDTIALVDKTSVMKAIYELQTLLDAMDEEIAEVQGDTLSTKLTARADGRVKAIYAVEGESVASAMYENGAVMILSLGGSMTVEIESTEAVAVGQTLTVTLSDETTVEGKVQQVRGGKITVTTTDNGPIPGDPVTVATADGTLLGTGTLEISSPLKVSGYFGTVSAVKVKLNQKVEAGDTLITLEDTEDLARYQQLLGEREELTDLLAQLSRMYQEGCIRASESGIVSGIDPAAAYTSLESRSRGGFAPQEPLPAETTAPTEETVPTEETMPTEETVPTQQPHPDGLYAGQVSQVRYGSLQIKISETDRTGETAAVLETLDEKSFTAERQYAPDLQVPVFLYQNGQSFSSSVNALQAGDKVLLQVENGAVTRIDFVAGTTTATPSAPSQGNSGSGMQRPSTGSSTGAQSGSTTEDEALAEYTVETATVCAITPAETMTISVSVDELDVLSLTVDQAADITLDALPGQSFSGVVKRISTEGTNEGGSTKFTVTVEVPRTEQMLSGMNASVLVEVGRLENVLTVPAEAVYEDGTRIYVYTALDPESGEPAGAVTVTTGASDGTVIQILSGLTEGQTVYYRYADSLVYQLK